MALNIPRTRIDSESLQLYLLFHLWRRKKPVSVGHLKSKMIGLQISGDDMINSLSDPGYINIEGREVQLSEYGMNYINGMVKEETKRIQRFVFEGEFDMALLEFLYYRPQLVNLEDFPQLLKDHAPQSGNSNSDGNLIHSLHRLRSYIDSPYVNWYGINESGRAYYEHQINKLGEIDKKVEEVELSEENKLLLQEAKEERTKLLKEASDVKDRIINEAKEMAKQEANKIISEAQHAINVSKKAALEEVEEVKKNTLAREIEFPPNLVEPGLSLLNHFSAIITNKYAGFEIKIRIEQIVNRIRLSITTPTGDLLEMVEEDLVSFGKVIKGEIRINDWVEDPFLIVKFKHRIELLSMELDLTKQINQNANRNIEKLEQEKDKLYNLIEHSFSHLSSSNNIISEMMAVSREDRQLYLILQQIQIELAKKTVDDQLLIYNLEKLKSQSPAKASKVGEYIINFFSSTTSGLLVEWIKQKIMGG